MFLTPKQARGVWCPDARPVPLGALRGPFYIPGPRLMHSTDGNLDIEDHCVGPACAAWRWRDETERPRFVPVPPPELGGPASRQVQDPLVPPVSLLCKLGSIIVHVQEASSPDGHAFDPIAAGVLLDDPEVKEWLAAMDGMAMIPKRRVPGA